MLQNIAKGLKMKQNISKVTANCCVFSNTFKCQVNYSKINYNTAQNLMLHDKKQYSKSTHHRIKLKNQRL